MSMGMLGLMGPSVASAAAPAAAAAAPAGISSMFGMAAMGGPAGLGLMAATSILGGISAAREARAAKLVEQRQARQGLNNMAYQDALETWSKRKEDLYDQANYRAAASSYGFFGNMDRIDPTYVNNYKPGTAGVAPDAGKYIAGNSAGSKAKTTAYAGSYDAGGLSSYGPAQAPGG